MRLRNKNTGEIVEVPDSAPKNPFVGSQGTDDYESTDRLNNIFGSALGAGAGIFGAKKLVKDVPKLVGSTMRSIAGIDTGDVKKLKDYGPRNVFTPRLESEEFIGKTLVPEVKGEIEGIIKQRKDAYGAEMGKISDTAKIDMGTTKSVLGDMLKNLELIDQSGNPIQKNLKSFATSNPVYRKLYDSYRLISDKGTLNKSQVLTFRDNLNTLFKDLPTDFVTQDAKNAVYADLENAGATGLRKAASNYKQVFGLEEINSDQKLASLFNRGSSVKGKELTRRALRQALPQESADRVISDLEKHRIAQSFSSKGTKLYPSGPGVVRKLSRPILKGYYENVQPIVTGAKKAIGNIARGGKGIGSLFSAYPMVSGGLEYAQDPMAYIGSQETGMRPEELRDIRKRYQEGKLTEEELYRYGLLT